MQTTKAFPAGTMVHMEGIPVVLTEATSFETHAGNWSVIDKLSKLAADPGEDSEDEGVRD